MHENAQCNRNQENYSYNENEQPPGHRHAAEVSLLDDIGYDKQAQRLSYESSPTVCPEKSTCTCTCITCSTCTCTCAGAGARHRGAARANFEPHLVYIVASVPGLPRSVRVLIMRRRPDFRMFAAYAQLKRARNSGTGEAWNRGYVYTYTCIIIPIDINISQSSIKNVRECGGVRTFTDCCSTWPCNL